jgi:hypothetical protein
VKIDKAVPQRPGHREVHTALRRRIRAYLYTSLKLFISKKLRSGRDTVSGLLAVDFDSVEFAMSAVDRSQLLYVRSDLAASVSTPASAERPIAVLQL